MLSATKLLSNQTPSRSMPAVQSTETLQFTEVYRDYRDAIYSFVYFRLDKDPDRTEDVVSDIFVKVYKSIDQYDDAYAVSTWLYTIAKHTLIDHYRRQKEVVDVEFEMMTDTNDPLYRLLTEQISWTEVETAVAALPEPQQQCVREQFWGQKNAKELAAELGVSHAAVRKHVSRGIATLRTALLSFTVLLVESLIFFI